MKKTVLAYSGGLDTSVLIKIIKEKYDSGVIAVTVDVGQQEDLPKIRERAIEIGANEALVIDARHEFTDSYIAPALKANALYEGVYPLATALARPLIVKKLVEIARDYGAVSIGHGCTGKGNDQVRFEAAIACLDPVLSVIAPVRELALSRDYEIEYARQNNIPVEESLVSYSIDENLWGRSIECGVLENENCEPPNDAFAWTLSAFDAPNYAAYLEIEFRAGIPVALNGKHMPLTALICEVNRIGGLHGVGRIDHIESRLVGIKSREVYEAPAAVVLIKAHQDLEKLVLTKDLLHFKPYLETTYADLIYNGLWFSPLRNALSSFFDEFQKHVNGTVTVKLFKGNVNVVGRCSNNGLYIKNLATYEGKDTFDVASSKGFIDIWSLPFKVNSMINNTAKASSDGQPSVSKNSVENEELLDAAK